MKAKCLVTGGAGFIGSHLVGQLLDAGYTVTVIDNLSTGRQENLRNYDGNKQLIFIREDISDFARIRPYFDGIDRVFHIAALADIVPSIVEPLAYYRSNVTGTLCVVEAARQAGVKKLLYAASSSCYGIPDIYPTPETADIRPQYPYALTKYLGEEIILHWSSVYKLPAISLRLFNVYGPRSRTSGTYGAVFGTFLAQKINNQPLTIVGDGKQTRDFIFVKDVVGAFMLAADSDSEQEFMNVGSGNAYSINLLAQLLEGRTVHIPKRPGEPDCTHADISKIKKKLGWKPHFSFQEGVKVMLDNIDYWKNAPIWTPDTIKEATRDWFRCLAR